MSSDSGVLVKEVHAESLGEALSQLSEFEKLAYLHSAGIAVGRVMAENGDRLAMLYRLQRPALSPSASRGAVRAALEILMLFVEDMEEQIKDLPEMRDD